MTEPVFLMGLTIAGGTLVVIVRTIAGAFSARNASRPELGQITERLDEAQAEMANQATQIAELQERLDFAERLLTKAREERQLGK